MVANPVVIVHGETRVLRVYLLVIVMTRLAAKLARARGREVKAKGLPVVLMGEIHPNAVHICESCQADVCNQCYSSWDRMCLGCKRHGPRWRETHHFPNTAPAEEGGKGAPPRRCAMEGIQGNVHSTPHHECKKCEKVVCGPCYDGWSRMCVPCMMATDMCSYCGSEGLVDHCCRARWRS